jgi:nucleoside-triphosphatase THEP1
MDELRVIVEGPPDSGKTTTARIIENALREAGYHDVRVSDLEPLPAEDKDRFQWRLERTRARPIRILVRVIP